MSFRNLSQPCSNQKFKQAKDWQVKYYERMLGLRTQDEK